MNSTLLRYGIPLMCVMVFMLLLAACEGGGSKEDVAGQTWDCLAESAPDFEQSMRMMLPTANNLEEAKEMYIYVSSAPPMEDLKEARDEAVALTSAKS